MIEKYSIRTDLALEQKERFESDHVEVQGVVLEEDYDEDREIRITRVKIETENGAKVMGKPVGTYITMEAPGMAVPDEAYHREISEELAKFLERFLKAEKEDIVLVKSPVGMPGRAIRNAFLERAQKGRIPHGPCHGCIKTCSPADTPYCITEALVNAVKGDVDNGLIFCGSNAWRAQRMEHVKDIMAEFA